MKQWSRYRTLVVTILLVLAVSAMWTVPVLADDATPPPPVEEHAEQPATSVDQAPVDTAVTQEAPAAPTVSEPPVVDGKAAVEKHTSHTSHTQKTTQLLAQVPNNTDVVVLDQSGNAVPLASQEAAYLLQTGDPIWCPLGAAPIAGVGGCTSTQTTLLALIDGFLGGTLADPKTNGVIWITGGVDSSGSAIVIDGADPNLGTGATAWRNFSLTLNGGWTGTSAGAMNVAAPSQFNRSLSILNWNGNITLNNIVIANVAGAASTALTVTTTKNVALTRLNVHDNGGAGVRIDNTAGTGSVVITSGNFTNNLGGTGLNVLSKGAITLSSVTASGNGANNTHDGAVLDNSTGSAQPVTLVTGGFQFNSNRGDGLVISSKGAVTLKDIDAIGNGTSGALIDNTYGTAGVTLTGSNAFSDTIAGSGLLISSNGAIKANGLIANSNAGFGAILDNSSSTTPQLVALTGTNQFKFNDFEGLTIYSAGAITLNNLTVLNNGGHGMWINNTYSGHLAPQNVTLTGYGTFGSNGGNGLTVKTYGIIALANVHANDNGGYGGILNNAGAGDVDFQDGNATLPRGVTLSVSGTNPDTNFMNNFNGGLDIRSLGAISLSGVEASNSFNGNGATLNNDFPGAVGGITLSGWGAAFSGNAGYGLTALSRGAITINHLYAWGNSLFGALLDNRGGSAAVSITGDTSYGFNAQSGLTILSKGAITLNTIYTQSNGGAGVILDNSYAGTVLPQNVTLNGGNHDFNGNGGNGLEIYSYGLITTNYLYSHNNGGFGALLDNCLQAPLGTCTANIPKAITLNGDNTFEWNGGNGLDLTSKGSITVNDLVARDNGGFGAFLDNQMTGALGTVTVKNTPTYWPEFARNGLDGLKIHSNGTITVMDLDSYENGKAGDPNWGYGVYLDNASGGGSGNVLLGTSRLHWVNGLNNNFLSGLEVYSNGTVTLSNIYANDNGQDNGTDPVYGYGALVDNSGSSLPKAVILKGQNQFINDWNGGLWVLSKGAISLNNITANDSGMGVILNNTFSGASAPQNITLTGFGDFFNNYNSGLEVYTFGAITLNNINANDNGQRGSSYGYGVYLDNFSGSTQVRPVVLNAISTNNNYTGGLSVHSLGAITITELDTNWNTGFGAVLDNNDGSPLGGVTILGDAFSANNGTFGLQVTSKGAILINVRDAWAGNNGTFGWYLGNRDAATPQPVTLISPNPDWAFDFGWNGGYGLWVESLGNISSTGLDANNNGGWGALLDNAWLGAIGTVTITTPPTGDNGFNGNLGDGLQVYSNRAITIGKLTANDNGWDCSTNPCTVNDAAGVWLDNTFSGASSPQNITVTGYGEFHNNGGTGLTMLSYGLITLSNLNASDNGQYNKNVANPGDIHDSSGWGAYLDNCGYDSVAGDCTDAITPKAITLSGNNTFNNNFQDGLWATSLGAIKASNLNANGNGVDGAYLNNEWSGALGGITLTTSSPIGWNVFNGNGALGLEAYSGGSISMSNIQANGNFRGGARLETFNDFGPASITLSGRNNFSGNGNFPAGTGSGLQAYATGIITLNNITANGNADNGAILDNWYAGFYYGPVPPLTISLTGANSFSNNGGDGLVFHTYGNAGLTKVTADNNGGNGVLGETHGLVPGNITLTCGSMTNNGLYGWNLATLAKVFLTGVTGYGNFSGNFSTAPTVVVRTCPLP